MICGFPDCACPRPERCERPVPFPEEIVPCSPRPCPKCGADLPISEFTKNGWCKSCCRSYYTTAYQRPRTLRRLYNLELEDFEALAERQGGRCRICGCKAKLCVDHDHDTGEVRGLLCGTCNTGLGMFKDNISHLAAAIEYLSCSTS